MNENISKFLSKENCLTWYKSRLLVVHYDQTNAITSNLEYYENPKWVSNYIKKNHCDRLLKERWQKAITSTIGSWEQKIVVDIGCGAGNIYETIGDSVGTPKLLIGVDISATCLQRAKEIGYSPVLADAHNLPLTDAFADVVAINRTLHHCGNMRQVLIEASRLVKPGGVLITDQHPTVCAWDWKGLAKSFYNVRNWIHASFPEGYFLALDRHRAAISAEIHHIPGDGVAEDLYSSSLKHLGFEVNLYPHNNNCGTELLEGGGEDEASLKYKILQRLSSIDSNSTEGKLYLMCVAKR